MDLLYVKLVERFRSFVEEEIIHSPFKEGFDAKDGRTHCWMLY
jgi:hypothetical protein